MECRNNNSEIKKNLCYENYCLYEPHFDDRYAQVNDPFDDISKRSIILLLIFSRTV